MPIRCLFYLFALLDVVIFASLLVHDENNNCWLKQKLPAINNGLSVLAALLMTALLIIFGLLLLFNQKINRLGAVLAIAMLAVCLLCWKTSQEIFTKKEPDYHTGFCSVMLTFFIAAANIAGYVVVTASG